MRAVSKFVLSTFRHERVAWGVLVLLCLATYWVLPNLQYRFGFKDIFDAGHPARQQYEEFQREFQLGPNVLVYFHGSTVFEPAFLEAMSDLTRELGSIAGVQEVTSALDLMRPEMVRERVSLQPLLAPEIYADAARLQQVLQAPPFTNHWRKLLYDDALEVFVMIITPDLDEHDPRKSVAFMNEIDEQIRLHAARANCDYELNGLFFVTQEVIQVTGRTQRSLVALILPILFLVVWALFANLRAAVQVFFLLGVSIYLGFGAMVVAGIPMNFMSTNFPLMILVIGTADIIHILGFFASLRTRYAARGAAVRAARRTLVPNLLTTVSTIGCIYFTSFTDLSILKQFSRSLCLGIVVVYAVTIVYGPLLFQRSGLRPGRGAFDALRQALIGVREPWLKTLHSRWLLWGFAIVAVLSLGIASTQRINSNWYRKFAEDQRLPQTLSFLRTRDLPISTLDCTLRTDRRFRELLEDEALQRDVRQIADVLRQEPDIIEVFTIYSRVDYVREQLAEIAFPSSLDSSWVEARRQSLMRAYLALGTFDEYLSPRSGRLRFVAVGNIEDSVRFLELRDALQAKMATLPLEVASAEDFEITGQMIYWSHIMSAIPDTFITSLWGSVLIVFLCFVLLTRGWRWALVAVLINVMPVVTMFAFARLAGWELTDNLCFLVSLSIGIAVDDTLHFLYHYRQARKRGLNSEDAAHRTLSSVGAALITTSVLLMCGFAVCLVADILTVRIVGALIVVSIFVALLLDLYLLPALLVRSSRSTRGRSEKVIYR